MGTDWGLPGSERLLDILLPRTCPACREDLHPPHQGPLCGACMLELRPAAAKLRKDALVWLDSVCAAYAYRDPLPQLVHSFKYRGNREAGRALAGWMAGLWRRHPGLDEADAVVAVPLHRSRERRRGFNQALILSLEVARSMRVPVADVLVRTLNAAPQVRYARERRAQRLGRAFACRAGTDLSGRKLLLIDDVYTSGGTLEGCARALKDAGAAKVRGYVLAR